MPAHAHHTGRGNHRDAQACTHAHRARGARVPLGAVHRSHLAPSQDVSDSGVAVS